MLILLLAVLTASLNFAYKKENNSKNGIGFPNLGTELESVSQLSWSSIA